jgi:hypothetical protein
VGFASAAVAAAAMLDLIASIVVDLSDQKLYAYNDRQQLVWAALVSTGKASTPTPTGKGKVLNKYRSITMRGRDYVTPDVPWALCISEDGNICLHGAPWQESAGMRLEDFKDRWMDKLVVMGGLDVQTTIGFNNRVKLQGEIERVIRMFAHGGLLFCTTHFVQDHCTIEELTFAYDLVYERVRNQGCKQCKKYHHCRLHTHPSKLKLEVPQKIRT